MDKENAVPATPHAGVKRSGIFLGPGFAPKRLLRTYRSEKPSPPIPFAPTSSFAESFDMALLDHMDALSLDPQLKDRIAGMHRQAAAEKKPSRRMRSILSLGQPMQKGPQRLLLPQLVEHLRRPARQVPVDVARQLRVALATESPTWIQSFIDAGGYRALLSCLDDLVGMEWREEQHDDTLLHEVLRCLCALASSPKGLACIQASAPAPMEQLVVLLFSDRMPAELDTRRLIIQHLTMVIPISMKPEVLDQRTTHHIPVSDVPCASAALASGVPTGAVLVLLLLHTARTAAFESKVDFLQRPNEHRPLRKYISHLQQVCGEFFWIFCHKENRVLDWHTLDVKSVIGPKVPSGITGGVEWDATVYLASHLRLLCAVLSTLQTSCPHAAYLFLQELEQSGLNRTLEAICMASQAYYTFLHAELAHLCAIREELRRKEHAPTPAARPPSSVRQRTSSQRSTVSHVRHVSIERVSIPIPLSAAKPDVRSHAE